MSENKENIEFKPVAAPKVSLLAELNGASIGVGIALLCVIIASTVLYIFMNLSPAKTVKVVDDADILTESMYEDIYDEACNLSKNKDINVIVVTTRNKGAGYSDTESGAAKYAQDFYNDHITSVPLQNNSGVCILIDLTLDQPGSRRFWIYTYGTAHFAVSNEECTGLFTKYTQLLGSGDYGQALLGLTEDLGGYNYKNYGYIIFFTLFFPMGIALLVTLLTRPKRRLDCVPYMSEYAMIPNQLEEKDVFESRSVVTIESSSSSGGFGGGGGSSGGGGGGFSGGGGGSF